MAGVADEEMDNVELLASPLTLPNGIVVPNRLVKASMEEGIVGGLPGRAHRRLYRRWGRGGWGIILTGNVAVDASQPATPHDLRVYDTAHTVPLFTELQDALLADAPYPRPLTLVQLSHAGMQSSATFSLARAPWVPAIAPVASRPSLGRGLLAWAFERAFWPRKSRAVEDLAEWLDIAARFVDAAATMADAGWGGVQVHSAHGYLLAEYLSPLTNPHPRPLPGVPTYIPLRLHLLWLILTGIHAATEKEFVKAVKINCSDFVAGGLDEESAANIIREIVSWRLVDLLEVSGGNYSNPAFTTQSSSSGSSREALFAHFTTALIPTLPPVPEGPAIMLTGGLHDRSLIASSLRNRACDLAGIGRPAALFPELPTQVLLNREIDDVKARVVPYIIPRGDLVRRCLGGGSGTGPLPPGAVKLVGASVSTFWHEWQMARLGRGEEPDPEMDWIHGLVVSWLWHGILRGGPRGWVRRIVGNE